VEQVMAEHPRLRVELDLTERLADPVLDRLDAVIRIGHLADSSLIATKLAEQRRLLVASPAYLDRAGTPDKREELERHRLIDKLHGADLLGWRDLVGRSVGDDPDGGTVFRCDDFEAMRLAARGGLGVALLPDWVVGPDVREGHLVRLSIGGEPWNAEPAGIWLLRALARPAARLQVVMAALRTLIGSPPVWAATLPTVVTA
jgi:DNA-binding transcriptional LysR family regulator